MPSLYQLLEHPFIYRLAQHIFAPGAGWLLARKIRSIANECTLSERILDIGCGPASWLWTAKLDPIGLDLSLAYAKKFSQTGHCAICGSAVGLPLADRAFSCIWSIGVFHHLTDSMVANTIEEMLRVCTLGGYVIILDAALPRTPWRRPVAAMIRRMDRGQHMRDQSALEALLPDRPRWLVQRFTYAFNGLEMLYCRQRVSE